MAAVRYKRYFTEKEIYYFVNMPDNESEGEYPRNMCEIDAL